MMKVARSRRFRLGENLVKDSGRLLYGRPRPNALTSCFMKRRLLQFGLALGVILGCALLWHWRRSEEAVYHDRRVTEWLQLLADPQTDVLLRDEASNAFADMGTNALPVLTNNLFATDSRYARWRHDGGEKLPAAIRQRLPNPLPAVYLRRAAAKQLSLMGEIRSSIPAMARALADPDRVVRGYCYNTLNRMRAPADDIVSGLLISIRSPDPSIREFGAGELGFIGPDAKAGVPALIIALDDVDQSVRLNAIVALGRIGPASKTAIPKLHELLHDPKPEVRLNTASTLNRIDLEETKVTVPIFVALLQSSDQSMIEVALRQLSDLGQLAKAAIPQVEALLDSPDASIRAVAEEALNRMDSNNRTF